jgi:hypothetical protein
VDESDSDNASNNQSNADVSIMDLTQDSDKDNEKIKKQLSCKTQGAAVDGFDNVNDYFESPKRAEGQASLFMDHSHIHV